MRMSELRREYTFSGLNENDLDPDPFKQFERWFYDAMEAEIDLPNSMTLATATKDGKPSARTVLLKDLDEQGFVFYTNYESQKGVELSENPYAALVFFWAKLDRQICIKGQVSKVSRQESETYFQSRPLESQMAAWASKQSQVIDSRKNLESKIEKLVQDYKDKDVPLPPYWGGFRLSPISVEFWQGRPNRLHDRFRYTRQSNESWIIERLAP